MIGVMVTGAGKLEARWRGQNADLGGSVSGVIRHVTESFNTRVKAFASGRPGPNAPTGNYRRSWRTSFSNIGHTHIGQAGTNQPQGRRLEYGFHGADALGRVYNQPPYVHVQPAKDISDREIVELAEKVVKGL